MLVVAPRELRAGKGLLRMRLDDPSVVMLCYVMLCYVMLCYVMLYYVMLCHVMICYVYI